MEIRCRTDHSPAIMEELLTGRSHLGFVLKCPPMAGIQMERIWCSRIVAVVHRSHRLARSKPKTLAAIAIAIPNEQLSPQSWGDGCYPLIELLRGEVRGLDPNLAQSEAFADGLKALVGQALDEQVMNELAVRKPNGAKRESEVARSNEALEELCRRQAQERIALRRSLLPQL